MLQVVRRKYQQEYDIAPTITFGADHVALGIPDDGEQTDSGWEIKPLHRAHVSLCWLNLSRRLIFNSKLMWFIKSFCHYHHFH